MQWWLAIITIIWAYIFARVIIHFKSAQIRGNWAQNRCDLAVMLTAMQYNPSPATQSNAAFAADNFIYCVGVIARSVLDTIFAPIKDLIGALGTAASDAKASVGVAESYASTLFGGLSQMFATVTHRYEAVFLTLRETIMRLSTMMGRLHAAGIAAVYMGISMLQSFFSAYKFLKLVVEIILGILVALLILLFFVLMPTIPLILAVIASVGVGSAAEFCFASGTAVALRGGGSRSIEKICIGDCLAGLAGHVTGVMQFDGSQVPLFSLGGVRVSGRHIVHTASRGWVCVKDAPEAIATAAHTETLYCLITEGGTIPIIGPDGIPRLFCDYEEIAAAPEHLRPGLRETWNKMAGVGGKRENSYGGGSEGIHPSTLIQIRGWGVTRAVDVRIGDIICPDARVIGRIEFATDGADNWAQIDGVLLGQEVIVETIAGRRRRAGQVPALKVPSIVTDRAIHFITSTGKIPLTPNLIIGDYDEIRSNSEWQPQILAALNSGR